MGIIIHKRQDYLMCFPKCNKDSRYISSKVEEVGRGWRRAR